MQILVFHRFRQKLGWLPWQPNCYIWIALDYYIMSQTPNMPTKFHQYMLSFDKIYWQK